MYAIKTLQCNSDVTKCNTELEIEKDIEQKQEQENRLIDIKKN